MSATIRSLAVLFLSLAPLAAQGLRLDLGRSTRGWEPELSLAWIEVAAEHGRGWALLDVSSGVGVHFLDGPGHGVARIHTDARVGAEGIYAAFGVLLDFDDPRLPGVGLRLQLGRQFSRAFHAAFQWEGLTSPNSAEYSPRFRGTFGVVAGVKF